ncbi:MAG TPA: LamG-like jellyroll fold domain-containing protein, partial [Pyrinomonadaceae bacterium]|nr:LamG-like jellyroll fold domain-containing protein [Pyrinomonadaceae bacterium]
MAWYPGDGNANDIARINNGTVHGSVIYAPGKVGQAFSSDGNFSGISLGNPQQLRSQTFTIEAWVKRASTTKATVDSADSGVIFGHGLQGYGFYLKNDGHLAFGKIGSYEILSVASGNLPDLAITDTNFHHVAVTRSTSNMIFYLDGVQGRATPLDDQFEFTTNAAIGARGDNFQNSFFGSIDEATVYNRALTQPEIQAVFNAATAGKCEATSTQLEHAAYPTNSISTVTINVTRTGNTAGASSVNYTTVDGTAKAGQDYTATSGTLSFAPGEQLKPIAVPILNNPAQTGDVSFNLALSGASGSALGSPASATVNIFYAPAGPGRIMVPGGDSHSDYPQAYNVDGTNNFHFTEYRTFTHLRYPSVARLTGTIAFQGCGEFTPTGTCDLGMRIFTMNGDGSGFRQVTNETGLDNPQFQADIRPVISPDGTKIAFISARPPAHSGLDEAFVVNTDGTNLHQVTTHQNVPNVGESRAYSVVWSPDSQKLLVHASRLGKDNNGNDTFISSLYTYNVDGTGETLVQRAVFDAPIALDWSPDGKTILYPAVGQIVFGYVLVDALNPEHTTFL